MDKSVRIALLFDFYGGLLTEKQREYIRQRYEEDLSLAEIAENEGVTRQGARDALVRAEKTLEDAERSTGLFARFGNVAALLDEIYATALSLNDCAAPSKDTIKKLINQLDDLKGKVTDGI